MKKRFIIFALCLFLLLAGCAPAASLTEAPTEAPAERIQEENSPVMTKIWVRSYCYQDQPGNAIYNAEGERLSTDGTTMEVLKTEVLDFDGMSEQRIPNTRQLRFVLTGGSGLVDMYCDQISFGMNVEFTSETVEVIVTAYEVLVTGEGMSYSLRSGTSLDPWLRLSALKGEDETCVHLTWGEDGLHVSTVQASKVSLEDMMGGPLDMPPGGFTVPYSSTVVDSNGEETKRRG